MKAPAIRVTVRFADPVNGPARLTAALVEIGRTKPATLHRAAK